MKDKTLKIVISLIVITIGAILFANSAHADAGFSVYQGDFKLTEGRFAPQHINGHGLLYCIQAHSPFSATMLSDEANAGNTTSIWCTGCGEAIEIPFSGARESIEYKSRGPLQMQNYQDAAYILAFGDNTSVYNAHAIWSSTINYGRKEVPGNELGQEAAAYLAFYQSIHSLNNKSGGTGEEYPEKETYLLPTSTDVHRVSVEKYNDDIVRLRERQFITEVTEALKAEWKSKYKVDLKEQEITRVERIVRRYYLKKFEELRGYPLPTTEDISIHSQRYYDSMIYDNIYVSKDRYVREVYSVLQKEWETKYNVMFTPVDEDEIRLKLEEYYDKNLVKKTEPVDYPFPPTPGDIIEASRGTQAKVDHAGKGFVPFEDYVTDAQCYLSTILWIHYGVNYTAEQIEGIKEGLLRPYYDEHFAKEEEEGELVGYSTNYDAFNSSNYQVEFAAYNRYDAEHIKKLAYATTYESGDYPQPTMSDVRKVAQENFYDEEEDEYTKRYQRTDFIERIMQKIEEVWWDRYEVDLNHFELHDVGELAAEFYDKYVNPGQKPPAEEDEYSYDYKYGDTTVSPDDKNEEDKDMDEIEYENEQKRRDEYYNNGYRDYDEYYYDETGEYPEPTMIHIHQIAMRDYYDEEEKKFYDDVTRDDFAYMVPITIEDEWWEKYKAIFEKVDKDRLVKLAKEYFDTYIRGKKPFNEKDYIVVEDPTMDDVHSIVKEKKYTKDGGKEAFANKIVNDMANRWVEQLKGVLSDEQKENVRNLARQYYDKYLGQDKKYSEGHTDQFAKLVKDTTNTDILKVRATRSTSTYVVGPFSVEYPNGNFNGVNKFSWITNVRVKDQNGVEIGNVENGTLQIIDKNGNLIYDNDRNGVQRNVPKNRTEFYIRFKSNTALRVSLTIDFKYLESIEAEAYRYDGKIYEWRWVKVDDGEHSKQHKCGEKHETCNRDGERVKCGTKYHWMVVKEDSHKCPQILMEVKETHSSSESQYANPIYAESSFTMEATIKPPPPPPGDDDPPPPPPPKLDLTMSIQGVVFLDQDGGKTNTGNNEYDIGEHLEGIDVWLYKKDGTFVGITLTDANGRYQFKELNAMHEYYVQFTYNGMLYTNVAYKQDGNNASKATEVAQNHNNNRIEFNNVFKEIGSYPANYSTKDCITGATITNKAYKQDEIVTLFKEVAKAMKDNNGDKVKAYNAVIAAHATDPEIKQKVQFIADIRINAYTVTNYAKNDSIKVDETTEKIGDTTYTNIYYEQLHVNLGIKARPTFDLALYKDVLKAEVQINGKSETYNYDKRTSKNGFSVGVSEAEYLNGVRGAYIQSKNYDNPAKRRALETDEYDLNLRSEEVANGQSEKYEKTIGVDSKYTLNNDYALKQEDRLKIYITYKIAVKNQSGVTGAVTEIVDYYDPNYKFIEAFIGDDKGNPTGKVEASERSKYANTDYKSSRGAYETIYLRPEEQRLSNNNKEQYIYVVLQVLGPKKDAGKLLSNILLNKNELSLTNLAEINGYRTYDSETGEATPGLIDTDSTPGNLDLRDISALTTEEIKKHEDKYEDDTSKAPALIYKLLNSRTLEGTVFEDATTLENKVRKGDGKLGEGDKGIEGVIVQLVEIKNGEMFVRSSRKTDDKGWYGFTGFLPGDYTIRYIYGADDDTAMATNSKWIKGKNETSYNGQDYQSTTFGKKQEFQENIYTTDQDLVDRYILNEEKRKNENPTESAVNLEMDQQKTRYITKIKTYGKNNYWYTKDDGKSDAKDDEYRRQQVIWYARQEYQPKEDTYTNTAVANHKAEVFNSYLAEQPEHITEELNRQLVSELERRTYRFAYTPEMPIEVEYATQTIAGTRDGYEHKIRNVDFGIAERPRAKTELTKNVEHIKVTTTDGTVLFDTNKEVNNLSWVKKEDRYQRPTAHRPITIIMDEELISGATVEITYKITVTNNGEKGESISDGENGTATTTMRRILDYVDNSLNFNEEDNLNEDGKALWKVVTVAEMQNESNATFINNSPGKDGLKLIDLSTQQTLLQTTPENPLSQQLEVEESATGILTLRKVIAAESDTDQLTYNNIMETIEIDNEVGRYDHDSIPGNQDPEKEPTEDDTFKSEIITILPPFGAKSYYWIAGLGIAVLTILGVGVFVIKKYVVDKKA